MFKAIQADFFRLLRSKGYHITQLIMIIFVALTIIFEATGRAGVSDATPEQAMAAMEAMKQMTWTSDVSLMMASSQVSMLTFFCLPLFVMIIGHDLSRETYKNIVTVGVSRWQFFASKFVVFMVMMALQFIIYYVLVFFIAGIKTGFGDLDIEFWKTFGAIVGFQYINMLAIFSIATITLYLLFSNVSAVITAVIIPMALTLLKMFVKWEIFNYSNFQINMDQAPQIEMGTQMFNYSILSALTTIVIALMISYFIFKKKPL